jgi:hypothetical protein
VLSSVAKIQLLSMVLHAWARLGTSKQRCISCIKVCSCLLSAKLSKGFGRQQILTCVDEYVEDVLGLWKIGRQHFSEGMRKENVLIIYLSR